ARVCGGAELTLAECHRRHEAAVVGQSELFGGPGSAQALALPAVKPWLPTERLQKEYDAIGFFLSGHPLNDYAQALERLRVQSWAEFSRAVKAGATAGRLPGPGVGRTERRAKTTRDRMANVGLSDATRQDEAGIFAEGREQNGRPLEPR